MVEIMENDVEGKGGGILDEDMLGSNPIYNIFLLVVSGTLYLIE